MCVATGGVYERTGGKNEGGHSMMVVGYDDNRRAWSEYTMHQSA